MDTVVHAATNVIFKLYISYKMSKIKAKVLLALIAVLAVYIWIEMPRVMIIGLSTILVLMSFSTIADLFKKDINENEKDKL